MITLSAQVVFSLGNVLYVSERWCNRGHVHMNECLCGSDIKLLVRPHYLPQEFMCAITIAVCITLSADAAAACDILSSTVANIQTQHRNAFRIISGDFKSCQILPTFQQYVHCPTRDTKTLDLCMQMLRIPTMLQPFLPLDRL